MKLAATEYQKQSTEVTVQRKEKEIRQLKEELEHSKRQIDELLDKEDMNDENANHQEKK